MTGSRVHEPSSDHQLHDGHHAPLDTGASAVRWPGGWRAGPVFDQRDNNDDEEEEEEAKRRRQEVSTHSTMTRSLTELVNRLVECTADEARYVAAARAANTVRGYRAVPIEVRGRRQ